MSKPPKKAAKGKAVAKPAKAAKTAKPVQVGLGERARQRLSATASLCTASPAQQAHTLWP